MGPQGKDNGSKYWVSSVNTRAVGQWVHGGLDGAAPSSHLRVLSNGDCEYQFIHNLRALHLPDELMLCFLSYLHSSTFNPTPCPHTSPFRSPSNPVTEKNQSYHPGTILLPLPCLQTHPLFLLLSRINSSTWPLDPIPSCFSGALYHSQVQPILSPLYPTNPF